MQVHMDYLVVCLRDWPARANSTRQAAILRGVLVTAPLPARSQEAASLTPGQSATSLRAQPSDVRVIPKRGLQFPSQLSFERWLSVGKRLSDIYTSSAWCLGDWLTYGEAAYEGRYREAIEQTSLDYQTLRNYAWVVKRFPLSRRRDRLAFGHHAEVAALPEVEQEFWLRKAEELGWPVKQLRREVRQSLTERSADHYRSQNGTGQGDVPSNAQPGTVTLQVHLTPMQLQACRAAADRVSLTTQDWAVLTLEEAARNRLDGHLLHTR